MKIYRGSCLVPPCDSEKWDIYIIKFGIVSGVISELILIVGYLYIKGAL